MNHTVKLLHWRDLPLLTWHESNELFNFLHRLTMEHNANSQLENNHVDLSFLDNSSRDYAKLHHRLLALHDCI